jgi:hypothetical protein
MHEDRLQQIVNAKHIVPEIAYGYDPGNDAVLMIKGTEIEQIARQLLALLERNRRVAIAVLSGNHRAIYREYARQWMPGEENENERHTDRETAASVR